MLKSKKVIVAISSILAVLLLGILAYEGTKQPVTVVLDGKEEIIRTHAKTVKELLVELKLEVLEEDKVTPPPDTELRDVVKVTWDPAQPVRFVVKGDKTIVWTTAKTVEEFIREQNYVLNEHDIITPSKDTKLNQDTEIIVETAFPITLKDSDEEKQVWTTSTTVADLLKQQEIKLNELDRVEPKADTQVTENMVVNVIRVEKVTDVVEVPVDYAVVTKKDASLSSGAEKVIAKGEEGLEKQYFEVVLENGKEVSRKVIKKEKVKDSKDRIVAIGTKPIKMQPARGYDGPSVKEFYVSATAYTAYCKGCSGITSTGINLRKNPDQKVIAVDPRVIPLGTKVWVEGYGEAIAADTGGAIKGNKIDVFIPDKATVDQWGRKKVLIKILE
ncbi:G5 and 3D domain-containing protein [Calidifontibacillus oryziterrae]|uniref:G5 and 3D domain-containing protein n=1 Tax=Calidifontibacillus oryziterrae TaxID=1191699 RepID=UPI0003200DB4|nr:G5 and 3D domain-containing protein [Calidifontibacillus oryziterrae]